MHSDTRSDVSPDCHGAFPLVPKDARTIRVADFRVVAKSAVANRAGLLARGLPPLVRLPVPLHAKQWLVHDDGFESKWPLTAARPRRIFTDFPSPGFDKRHSHERRPAGTWMPPEGARHPSGRRGK